MNRLSWLLGIALVVVPSTMAYAETAADCPPAISAGGQDVPTDPYALLRLGDLYYTGGAVERDYRKAFRYYQLAAETGNETGKLRMGEMLATGAGIPQEVERGRKLVKEVADTGSQSALVSLGDLYARGNGGPMDAKLALAAYEKAAKLGNARAMLKLADIYRYGRFSTVNNKLALAYYKKAADAGNGYGLWGMGGMYLEGHGGSVKDGVKLLDDASKAGVVDAVVKLANSYFQGDGVKRSSKKALALLDEAAAAGNMTAASALVAAYRDGKLNRGKYIFRPNLSKASAVLKSFAKTLPDADYEAETFLLKVAAAGPQSYSKLYRQLVAFPAEIRMPVYRQSRDTNLNFYTYATQNKLRDLGIYKGKLTGTLNWPTLRAMTQYCNQIGTDYFCNHPPATGYYGELLSYAFRDVGKADENCPAEATN